MEKETEKLKTVQEEWTGTTPEKDEQEETVVVRESACYFD